MFALLRDYTDVEVISGPPFLPIERYVKYQVIGKSDVAVPTHFFKVIIAHKKILMKKAYRDPGRISFQIPPQIQIFRERLLIFIKAPLTIPQKPTFATQPKGRSE